MFYLLEKARDASFARSGVERLMTVFGVAPIDEGVLRRALVLAWPDFEDAVCAASAEACGCEAIVTRDPDGFPDSPVAVVDPAGALSWILGPRRGGRREQSVNNSLPNIRYQQVRNRAKPTKNH